ncbi:MAG TPA: glycosyltransferase family 39 protein [Candidatus Acidoferrum sp.]|nr:glycosyltransferase family 39 protein [Candidatus Acidoferrum sp.]
MTQPTTPSTENTRISKANKIGWGVLICATLYVCYFSHLSAIGFVGPDEPRYAWIARDMMESGDWITPRLYGKPWFEKPPLFYWAAGLCFKWLGVSETAARLPSAISALLATLALAWLALRWYGAETARWLLLLLPTTVGMIGFSHAAATDMPFSAMLTIAMVCAAVILGLTRNENTPILRRTPWFALVLFGLVLGLAVLAKGPAAIILCGGAVFFWALFTKRWRDAFRLLHPAAIVSFCVTALPWYFLCARRNPDFFRVFIIEHNFKRYVTPEFQHIQPFWFYVPVLLVAFLPWTALLLWSLFEGAVQLWRTRSTSHSTLFLLCWAGFCAAFFSISQSKLPGYVLPAVPAIATLLSSLYVSRASAHQKSFRLAMLSAVFLFAVLIAILATITPHVLRGHERLGVIAGTVIGLMGISNLFLVVLGQRTVFRFSHGLVVVLPILAAVVLSKNLVNSYFYWDPSGKTIARELQLRKTPVDQLAVANIKRGMQYSLSFYLHKEVENWGQANSKKEYVLSSKPSCRTLAPTPFACEPMSFDEKSTGVFLYHVVMAGSVDGSTGGGQSQQEE